MRAFGEHLSHSILPFARFAGLWTLLFSTLMGFGVQARKRWLNAGIIQLLYLFVTFAIWIAVGACLQVGGGSSSHARGFRLAESLGWVEVGLICLACPYVMLGLSRANQGIWGAVAVKTLVEEPIPMA